ncbi:dUTP diphosphatase [Brevibacillus sp. JB24b]|uniref:dUTP diphosphatase n=1 Tax=Brevibacillus sp. JB24b TaxID=3422308 RepID=UPI003F688D11
MQVKIKKLHPDAVIPTYATPGSAGFDLVAVEETIIEPGETVKIPLGLVFEIPRGYVFLLCMRSGIAIHTALRLPNGVGVIDSDYRGEVSMIFENSFPENDIATSTPFRIDGSPEDIRLEQYDFGTYIIRKGDRVAQGIITPVIQASFVEVDELSDTKRGTGGFGSTGVRSDAK